jgi:hypothetical protein
VAPLERAPTQVITVRSKSLLLALQDAPIIQAFFARNRIS